MTPTTPDAGSSREGRRQERKPLYDEALLQTIIDECNEHNREISDDEPRQPERVRRDAEFIYMHRHAGITVETLAMMLTDYEFAVRAAKATPVARPGPRDAGQE